MSTTAALIGVAILSCLMSVAVLGSLFQARIPGVRRWCAASGLLILTAALVLAGRSDRVVVSAATLLVLASVIGLQGFRQFFHLRLSSLREYGAAAAILAGVVYWTCVSPDIDARSALISGLLAYVRFNIGWIALRYRPAGRPKYGYYFVAVAAILGAIVHTVRCVVYGLGLAHEATFLAATPINIAFLSMAALTLPCLSVGMIMLAHDRLAERMECLATIDDLTGVLGRRAFIARAEALFDALKTANSKLSIAILDIDNFKGINDRYGHAAGDRILAHVASTISGEARPGDVVGRIGGEEFALLLPSTGKEEAARLTNRMRAIVAASRSPTRGDEVVCTLSAGVDEFGDGDTLASAMARADAALYAAKANGRNCVMVAPSGTALSPLRLVEAEEANALNRS